MVVQVSRPLQMQCMFQLSPGEGWLRFVKPGQPARCVKRGETQGAVVVVLG